MIKSNKFTYNDKKHEYRLNGKKLNNVTTFCKQFFSKFDAKAVARELAKAKANKAAKRGVRYWLNLWKESAQHGTDTHVLIEQYILGDYKCPDVAEERTLKKFLQAVNYLQSNIKKTDILRPELKIYDEELGMAGTIDLLQEHEDGSVSLHDWKTNKKDRIKKPQRITPKTKMALSPFDFLVDGSYSTYCLQLSVYAFMLERQGKVIRNLYIVHLLEDTYIPYEVPYRDIKRAIEVYFDEQRTK